MASSNRHWPSMFKSKPCNTHHQWQHDINPSSLISTGCHGPPYTSSVGGCDERSPEPKPRWNPKPEQIRILEAIFNSGMVNPPRDEIRKIRAQLQEYGQVGDANVFYWFQNRKSRSKHKLRHLHNSKQTSQTSPSSSHKSSPKGNINKKITTTSTSSSSNSSALSLNTPNFVDLSHNNSSTGTQQQTYFQPHTELLTEPFFFPPAGSGGSFTTQGFGYSELLATNVVDEQPTAPVGPCTSLLLSEIMNHGASKKDNQEKMKVVQQPQLTYAVTVPSTVDQIQVESLSVGVDHQDRQHDAGRSTVFINDVAFEVGTMPFNVKEAFGEDAVLINSSGQPLPTNEWGVTLHPLQHGAFYYLI
ncbi:WUSCHEL-related homeobox 9 isoform X2 [Carica papaya]|uniref:WUSCHEL-related homeobox 9 isoform X2 n=1 Tax=Carica papaya TaxID=3649 RepID=UPI000B8CB239|nr:WUSCHEL-related homeobox 9 isoform X2 [Carica papaya]